MTSEVDQVDQVDEVADLVGIVGRWWEDPRQTALHRLPASTSVGRDDDADHWRNLGGQWQFQLVDSPLDAPAGWTTAAEQGDRPTLTVPGCWTRQDVGDHPHYTNAVMPFRGDPPAVPEHDPTGLYRTTFVRPRGWATRRTILHIGGAESAAAVWCNGTFVGLLTDSRLPSEFDLTPMLAVGPNMLAIMVVRWSAATWLEDQDQWFHAGLHRRVFLRSVAPTSLADVRITATLDPDGSTGQFDVATRVDGPSTGWRVETQLETMGGRAVRSTRAAADVSQFDDSTHLGAMLDAYRHPGPWVRTAVAVGRVSPWSHETPNRYRAVIRLLDPTGAVRDERRIVTGFRRVEIRGAELLLNGQPLLIAGVNRHDHDHRTGKALTDEDMRADMLNIKHCGFNAVRTSHYPPDPVVLDVCDEIGLWVVCEANVESHGRWEEVVHDQRFELNYVERVQRMVATHWNHPSVIGWSLGNEAGYGPAHDAAAAWVRATDPSRFVQYEGAVMWRWREGFRPEWRTEATDIECPMYPSVGDLVRWATETGGDDGPDKPLILCEYSHAMGNSNGDLADYWAAFETHHGLQGGFIWDWRDQGLLTHDAEGREYFGYGGAFGDEPNDAAFCCNGMVGPDGTPHPAVEEHRWLTRPVRCELVTGPDGTAMLRVHNRRSFIGLDDIVARVEIAVDGRPVWSKRMPRLDVVAPGASVDVPVGVPVESVRRRTGDEAFLTVTWSQRRATAWAPPGHVVAWDQMAWPVAAPTAPPRVPRTTDIDVVVDEITGLVTSVSAGGRSLLSSSPELAIWRAPVDNDGVLVGPAVGAYGPRPRWEAWGLDRLIRETLEVSRRGGATVARHRWTSPTGIVIEHVQRIRRQSGSVRFDEDVRIPVELDDIPRVGVRYSVPRVFADLRWFGRGPWETAADRRAAPVGVWASSVADQYVPYVTPQHHGSHVDTRWFELVDAADRGLHVRIDGATFDASHLPVEQLTAADTANELRPTPEVHVHIDAAQRGVGTGACGPDTMWRIGGGRYRFTWWLGTTP